VLLQQVGTDIENCLLKYRVSYGHLIFTIETIKLLMKAVEKIDLLFVHIECATACSLKQVYLLTPMDRATLLHANSTI